MSAALFLPALLSASLLASVGAAPVSTPASSGTSSSTVTPTLTSASPSQTDSRQPGYILLDWDTSSPTPTQPSSGNDDADVTPVASSSAALTSAQPAEASPTIASAPTKTASFWALPPQFSNMDPFGVTSYAAGEQNIAVLRGAPVPWSNGTSPSTAAAAEAVDPPAHSSEKWDMGYNSLQITYPEGSINPGNKPQGGAEFYAEPLDLRTVTNTTLQYSVYFPHDFDFVKGGKLPGLYGGHKGCSGGNAAEDCFSTRIMWRAGGKGELYLYVPKDKQTPQLCSTPPQSICNSEYGVSIGRGAWTFPRGDWTTIRQDIWLNTPGLNDGGFNVWINGNLVMSANDVRYRENAVACTDTLSAAAVPEKNEDWSSLDAQDVNDPTSIQSPSTSSAPSTTSAMTSTTSTKATASTSASSSSPTSATSSAASTAMSTSTGSTIVTSRAAQATFQTPMRRWIERDDLESFGAADMEDEQSADSTSPSAKPFVPTSVASAVSQGLCPSAPTETSASMAPDQALAAESAPTTSDDGTEAPGAESMDSSAGSAPATTAGADTAQQEAPSTSDDVANAEKVANCGVGFIGLFFSTFFGGHTADWATPKDQVTYYKDFEMWANDFAPLSAQAARELARAGRPLRDTTPSRAGNRPQRKR